VFLWLSKAKEEQLCFVFSMAYTAPLPMLFEVDGDGGSGGDNNSIHWQGILSSKQLHKR
jgi:hypothetical protein